MEWNLREIRFFIAAAETGSFTEAASDLHVSQASVSRTIASFEKKIGDLVLRRVPQGCELTALGQQLLPQARRLLFEASRFDDYVSSRQKVLRLGYAWAALGSRTTRLQRTWAAEYPDRELHLVRHNSSTAGLREGICDVAIIRRTIDDRRFESVVVGLERRFVAFASDDPTWARRRQIKMAEVAERTVVIDPRTGTTDSGLWAGSEKMPKFIESFDVDDWLDTIAAGQGVGTTAEATSYHHARPGVTYRPLKDGPRIPVRLFWWRDDPPSGLSDLVNQVTRLYEAS